MTDTAAAVRRLVDDGLPVKAAQIIVANQHDRDNTTDLMAYADRLIAARQSPMGRQARREP